MFTKRAPGAIFLIRMYRARFLFVTLTIGVCPMCKLEMQNKV